MQFLNAGFRRMEDARRDAWNMKVVGGRDREGGRYRELTNSCNADWRDWSCGGLVCTSYLRIHCSFIVDVVCFPRSLADGVTAQ